MELLTLHRNTAFNAACRFCAAPLTRTFVDLGTSPLCQRHVTPADAHKMEPFYPLHAYVCEKCFLVQLAHEIPPAEIFTSEYGYFSSFSESWLAHAAEYAARITERLGLNSGSFVVELASNDGYLLKNFVKRGMRVLGVEPCANVAAAAVAAGVPTVVQFFGKNTARQLAAEHGRADLIAGNNVLAHVPDLNDFVAGIKIMLAPGGVLTMEFPHLLKLIEQNQFDTIYHEHFSYFSFTTVQKVFAHHGITLFDVEELATHGGSLRIYGRHAENRSLAIAASVEKLLGRERDAGMNDLDFYAAFGQKVQRSKRKLLVFLIAAKQAGKSIAGYGAPGKGNTLLNYCGIRTDFLDYTVDRSPHKQGNFLPGTRIPIYAPDAVARTRPDYLLILPWNLAEEIMRQMAHVRAWGGKFVVPIPEVRVLE